MQMKKIIRNILHRAYSRTLHAKKLKKNVTEKVGGYRFNVYPSVFNPKTYIASEIFANFITVSDNLKDKNVLDMGCGSGVLSVFALSKGANVTSVDVNPVSVKCSEENIMLNGFSDRSVVIVSNLFANIQKGEKFDVILFNPPYYKGEPKNDFEKGFYGGKNLEVLQAFLISAKQFLTETGVIYMILSDDADLQMIKQISEKSGFKLIIENTKKKYFETFYIYKMF